MVQSVIEEHIGTGLWNQKKTNKTRPEATLSTYIFLEIFLNTSIKFVFNSQNNVKYFSWEILYYLSISYVLMCKVLLWMYFNCFFFFFHVLKLQNQGLELRLRQNGGCHQIKAINISIRTSVIFLVGIHNRRFYMTRKDTNEIFLWVQKTDELLLRRLPRNTLYLEWCTSLGEI